MSEMERRESSKCVEKQGSAKQGSEGIGMPITLPMTL
jgi:hypothetical protein